MAKIEELLMQIYNTEGKKKIELQLDFAYKYRVKSPRVASQQAVSAYKAACILKENVLELRSIYLVCITALYYEEFIESEEWLDLLARRGKELEHPPSIGRSLILKSRWSARIGKNMQAAKLLKEALQYFTEDKNVSDLACIYNGLGNLYIELEEYNTALEYFEKALEFAKHLNKNFTNMIKQNIALIYMKKQEYVLAWTTFHQVIDNLDKNDLATKRVVMLNLAHICQQTRELEEALSYLDDVIKLSKEFPEHFLIRPLCNKALILTDIGDFSAAMGLFSQAEKLAEDNGNKADQQEVCYGFAELYEKWQKQSEEIKYLKKIINLEKEINNESCSQNLSQLDFQKEVNRYKKQISALKQEITRLKKS